jgi:hypothetical protein
MRAGSDRNRTARRASEGLTFSPALPSQYHNEISGLPNRPVEKIALQFNKDVFSVREINTLATPLVDKINDSFVQAELWSENVGSASSAAIWRETSMA